MSTIRTLATLAALTALTALGTSTADAMGRGNGNGNGNGNNGHRADVGRARAVLVRDAGSVDDDAKGRIDVATRPGGKSELRVKGQRLDPLSTVDLTIEDDGLVEQVFADAVEVDDEGGVHVKVRDWKGDELPLGATSLEELAGRRLRIRVDGTGDPLLVGVVPAIGTDLPRRFRGRADLANIDEANDPDAKGRVVVTFRSMDLRSGLKIKVARVAPGAEVVFLMSDADEGGTLTALHVDPVIADADGEAVFRVRTNHGDALPFGAAHVLELSGREIRVDVDGVPQLSGNVPGE